MNIHVQGQPGTDLWTTAEHSMWREAKDQIMWEWCLGISQTASSMLLCGERRTVTFRTPILRQELKECSSRCACCQATDCMHCGVQKSFVLLLNYDNWNVFGHVVRKDSCKAVYEKVKNKKMKRDNFISVIWWNQTLRILSIINIYLLLFFKILIFSLISLDFNI